MHEVRLDIYPDRIPVCRIEGKRLGLSPPLYRFLLFFRFANDAVCKQFVYQPFDCGNTQIRGIGDVLAGNRSRVPDDVENDISVPFRVIDMTESSMGDTVRSTI